jgi:hypothetical protein
MIEHRHTQWHLLAAQEPHDRIGEGAEDDDPTEAPQLVQ